MDRGTVSGSSGHPEKKTSNPVAAQKIVATYSQLLALEPRLVFDASVGAVLDAADDPKNTPGNGGGAHGPGDRAPAVDAQSGQQAASQNPDLAAEEEAQNILSSFTSLPDDGEFAEGWQTQEGGVLTPLAKQMEQYQQEDNFMEIMALSSAPIWTEPPTLTFSTNPDLFTVKEDGELNLGLAGVLTLTEGPGGSTDFTITISVKHGTLSLALIPGAQSSAYTLSDDERTATFSGDIDFCRALLATLKYTGDEYWHGMDTLTITIQDGVNADGYNSGERAVVAIQEITVLSVPNRPEFLDLPSQPPVLQLGSRDGEYNGVW